MARITDQELFEIEMSQRIDDTITRMPGAQLITGLSDPAVIPGLVAEVRRLRAMIDRCYEHCSFVDAELDAEVLEIRQERRSQAVAQREKEGR